MPRFNRLGDWNSGVGGGDEVRPVTAVCNGRVIDPGPGGAGDWLSLGEFICARGGYREIHAIHKTTGAHRLVYTEPSGMINAAAAGGGRWASRRNADGVWVDDTGATLPYPVIGFADDGSLVTQAHPYNGSGLIIDGRVIVPALSNEETIALGAHIWDVCVFDRDRAIWRQADGPHVLGLPRIQLLPGVSYGLRAAFDGGRWWVLYQASEYNGQLVLHPFDSFEGYALTASGANAYRADVIAPNGTLHVVWASVVSEQLQDIVGPIAPQTDARFTLANLLRPPDPPDPPDPEPPIPPDPPDPEPPDPPDPEPPDPDGGIDMTPQHVAIRGAAGLYARIDPGELGHGPFKGYPIHFDRTEIGPHELFELSKPDDAYQILHVATGAILGADATSNGADLCSQFYTSGGDVSERGPFESWTVFRLRAGGTICALIEYDQDGVIYTSGDFNLEEVD